MPQNIYPGADGKLCDENFMTFLFKTEITAKYLALLVKVNST